MMRTTTAPVRLDDDVTAIDVLRELVAEIRGLRRLSAKSIGRLLARADGVPIDGWLVERCGVEINVALWHVVSVSHRLESGTGFGQSGAINVGAT